MARQMTLFDWMEQSASVAQAMPEPEVGEYTEKAFAVIPHIMRPSYIGRKVLIDVSTQSREIYQCGILERYIPYEGTYRSIVYTGDRQRSLITHRPGIEIRECLPWNAYPKRMAAIGQNCTRRKGND